MTDEPSNDAPRWLRFRLTTLLWLMIVVAAFFGGRRSVEISPWATPATRNNTQPFNLTVGKSFQFRSNSKMPRVTVNQPSVCNVTPLSSHWIQVNAFQPGSTSIQVWSDKSNQPQLLQVVVKN